MERVSYGPVPAGVRQTSTIAPGIDSDKVRCGGTGESRRYNAADGSFGAITPRRTLGSDGGIGHIMLSARYEDWDATDGAFGANRNDTSAWTLGATWVPISHVKFQANYSQTEVDYVTPNVPGTRVDNNIRAVTFRTQFDW